MLRHGVLQLSAAQSASRIPKPCNRLSGLTDRSARVPDDSITSRGRRILRQAHSTP